MKKKRLLIDANSIIPYYMNGHTTGLGRTTFELINALAQLNHLPFEIILFSQNLKGISPKGKIPLESFHIYLPNRTITKKVVNGLRIKKFATHYDLYHIPHNTDFCESLDKTIFTIHDLIVYRYPEMWNATEKDKDTLNSIGCQCKAIITCSESSKKDILHFWNLPEEKVTAIPWGINQERFHPTTDRKVLLKNAITDSYFFSASCNHPRKNTAMLLAAYRRYLSNGGEKQLVLLSPMDTDISGYEDLIANHKVVVTRDISDSDLVSLYSQAHCTLMVSSFEGFGLPVLESLACGTQVLSANNSSLSEVGGKVVEYFDELNSQCICSKMLEVDELEKRQLLDDNKLQDHLSHFTWQRCAEKYVSTYERLLYNK